jgi:disulfide bond formation protein DsbB
MSITPQPAPTRQPQAPAAYSPFFAWLAVGLAAVASLGGIYLFYVEHKVPCALCFYQRSFAYASLAALLVGLLGGFNDRVAVSALTLPLAFAGLGVALFHVYLERAGVLECPSGAFGLSTAPKQSAIVFGLLCAALILDAYQPGRFGGSYSHVVGAAVAGVLVAAACIYPNPGPAPTPPEAYKEAPSICRPPYVAPASQ